MEAIQVKSVADLKKWLSEVYPQSAFFETCKKEHSKFFGVKNRIDKNGKIYLKQFTKSPIIYEEELPSSQFYRIWVFDKEGINDCIFSNYSEYRVDMVWKSI